MREWVLSACPLIRRGRSSVLTEHGKTGCPSCAKYGFKPDQPAWLYLLERPGEQQIGITNKPEVRIKKHLNNGWNELEIFGPLPGQEALAIEGKIKAWLKKNVGLIPGKTENWPTSMLEVRRLAELIARSSLKTELQGCHPTASAALPSLPPSCWRVSGLQPGLQR
jgi:hypothetical protein